jgi:hypothetical protein
MSTRKPFLVLVILLFPASSRAHTHKADAAVGGGGASGSVLVGPYVSFARKAFHKRVMVLGDVSNHFSTGDEGVTKLVYTVGARWWLPHPGNGEWKGVHPYIQGTASIIRKLTENAPTITDFAPGLSAGADFFKEKAHFGARLQFDGMWPSRRFEKRVSVGVVYRFEY